MKYLPLFEEFVAILEKKGDTYSKGCAMLYLNVPKMKEVHQLLKEEDLYQEEGDRTFGIEDEPHVTLLYGIHSDDVKDSEVEQKMKSQPIGTISLKNPSAFENEKFDVLKFDVDCDGIHDINKALCELPHTNDFPDYHPHVTIAYLKPGKAKEYIEMINEDSYEATATELVYSKPKEKLRFPLD